MTKARMCELIQEKFKTLMEKALLAHTERDRGSRILRDAISQVALRALADTEVPAFTPEQTERWVKALEDHDKPLTSDDKGA